MPELVFVMKGFLKLLCRPQTEHIQQDAEDNTEPSEHPDVFPTPEKTESLINLSQVDVPTDSTYSLTPAISNMIIPCMSMCDCCNLSFWGRLFEGWIVLSNG